jgi:hypothetical protein
LAATICVHIAWAAEIDGPGMASAALLQVPGCGSPAYICAAVAAPATIKDIATAMLRPRIVRMVILMSFSSGWFSGLVPRWLEEFRFDVRC